MMMGNDQRGGVLLLVTICLVLLVGVAGMVVDFGNARNTEQKLQVAVDAAAFAAARLIPGTAEELQQTVVEAEVKAFAAEHGVPGFEIDVAGGVELGVWDATTESFTVSSVNPNAVRVRALRSLATTFGRIWQVVNLAPHAGAIASARPSDPACVKPFGIATNFLQGVSIGQSVVLSSNTGNWGKLDLGEIEMSSGTNFDFYMKAGVCGLTDLAPGSVIPSTPGNGGPIRNTLEDMISTANRYMLLPVVTPFSNGNSNPVTCVKFAQVMLESVTGNGGNWRAQFKILGYLDSLVSTHPNDVVRQLVH